MLLADYCSSSVKLGIIVHVPRPTGFRPRYRRPSTPLAGAAGAAGAREHSSETAHIPDRTNLPNHTRGFFGVISSLFVRGAPP